MSSFSFFRNLSQQERQREPDRETG